MTFDINVPIFGHNEPQRRPGAINVATFPASFHIAHSTLRIFMEAVMLDRRN